MHYLSRGQGEQQGIPVGPVTAPEVEQPLLLEAVVATLCQAGQHVQCQRASPLFAQEHQSQACTREHTAQPAAVQPCAQASGAVR